MAIQRFELDKATDLNKEKLPIQTVDGYSPDANGNVDTKRLPLSGGTMKGAIIASTDNVINRSTDDRTLTIFGATSAANGANISLYGKDHDHKGRFTIRSSDGSNTVELLGNADGSLTWGGKTVNVGGVYITETWKSDGGLSWYRKWSDGWIEQGCTVTDGNVRAFTFPVPFSSTDYTFIASARLNNTNAADISCAEYLHTRKTTGVQVTCRWNTYDNSGVAFSWFACGY